MLFVTFQAHEASISFEELRLANFIAMQASLRQRDFEGIFSYQSDAVYNTASAKKPKN